MLYLLLYPLHTTWSVFNVFRYITFRTIYATVTAFLVCFILGPWVIRKLAAMQVGQFIQDDGPQTHLPKEGTPTMGGTLIVAAVVAATLLWADITNMYVWVMLFVIIGFGTIGFIDDYLKQVKKRNMGLTARTKFSLQFFLALIAGVWVYLASGFSTEVAIPFFKQFSPDLGVGYILFAVLVIVGTSNAVNLTDGLDGLAIGPVIIAAGAYMAFAYVSGHFKIANYLQVQYVAGSGELAVFCGAVAGAGLGFLWFNAYPAQIFMGDVGSLSLGAILDRPQLSRIFKYPAKRREAQYFTVLCSGGYISADVE